ncbi:MAG: DUF3617 domain-containing protein [Rhodanobacter sp.]
MSTSSLASVGAVLMFALLAMPACAQSDSGNMMKMNVTMKMQMPGAGDIPAQATSQNVCMSRDLDMRAMLQQQKDCSVSDYRQVGQVVSYHVACGGNPPRMTGDARFELLPGGSIKGSVHANSSMGGKSMVMDMTYAGERIGSCDYAAIRQRH